MIGSPIVGEEHSRLKCDPSVIRRVCLELLAYRHSIALSDFRVGIKRVRCSQVRSRVNESFEMRLRLNCKSKRHPPSLSWTSRAPVFYRFQRLLVISVSAQGRSRSQLTESRFLRAPLVVSISVSSSLVRHRLMTLYTVRLCHRGGE